MKSLVFILIVILISGFVGYSLPHQNMEIQTSESTSVPEQRESFISDKNYMISTMMEDGNYSCCLEKPCTYCIEKTPGHGEGAACTCLEDVVNHKHPCGECIGEILEGHGNRFLTKHFASSIAEEVGQEHIDTIKQIISNKYDVSLEEQI